VLLAGALSNFRKRQQFQGIYFIACYEKHAVATRSALTIALLTRGGPMKARQRPDLVASWLCSNPTAVPHTSNDNPFSGKPTSRTLKYQPEFPKKFETIEQGPRLLAAGSLHALTTKKTSSTQVIGLMTPDSGPLRTGEAIYAARQETSILRHQARLRALFVRQATMLVAGSTIPTAAG